MNNIIVIGGSGQLGQCLQEVVRTEPPLFNYVFLSQSELDLSMQLQVESVFEQYKPLFCINCAAYTAVDHAEEDHNAAHQVNEYAVKRLAETCAKYQSTLVHISTDFVFDGLTGVPLSEESVTNPINVYGLSKLKGEQAIPLVLNNYYIFRTSWLYSEKANNFCKTMLKLAQIKDQLQVISDQVGTPTYAMDLAKCIVQVIKANKKAYGIYHYSNEGVASWYDFAKAIFDFAEVDIEVIPVNSDAFKTKARRPHYSVLDKSKIKNTFDISIPYWRESLNRCINKM
ncbi:dTDP-4-dehydrorhamnose reductase [Pedobacter immunditicola]|uniref:dTDP-4-dehydrorhamnose reductase n=1 Tax=Pedobacter immunditicola TaxID=3133440 RepID=UPI0030B3ECD8